MTQMLKDLFGMLVLSIAMAFGVALLTLDASEVDRMINSIVEGK